MKAKDDVSVKYIKKHFYLDDFGNVRNKVGRGAKAFKGAISGRIDYSNAKTPYRRISIGGKEYHASRIAFVLIHGRWPTHQIAHLNHDGLLNHPENIIDATQSENLKTRPIEAGLHEWNGGWYCRLIEGQRTKCSKLFPTFEKAKEFKREAEVVLAALALEEVELAA